MGWLFYANKRIIWSAVLVQGPVVLSIVPPLFGEYMGYNCHIHALLAVIDVSECQPPRIPSKKWRKLIKKVWEVDPLICSHGGTEACEGERLDSKLSTSALAVS